MQSSCLLQYSATSALYGGTLLPYFLNEGQAWELDIGNLRGQIKHVSSPIGNEHAPLACIVCRKILQKSIYFCRIVILVKQRASFH